MYRKLNEELQHARQRNLAYAQYLDNLRAVDYEEHIQVRLQCEISELQDEISELRDALDRLKQQTLALAAERDAIQVNYENFKADTTLRENAQHSEYIQALREYKEREDAYITSRGYRLWRFYNRLYQVPVLGTILARVRAVFKK